MEKRKKGCAVAGRVSRGVRPWQMRVVPYSLFLLPTISQMVWSSRSLLTRELSRGAAGGDAASEFFQFWWSYVVPWRCRTWADFRGGENARVDWMRTLFGKG
jgi:hypothetical protein